ncbi:MAG: HAD family hydrolase [bacterium]|nr:HAD family hydrolase [bacterium]
MNKTVKDFVSSKRAVLFDLFHTLTSLESKWGQYTSDFLGIDREVWTRELTEKSRYRLSGEEKDPFTLVKRLAHSIDPNIPLDLIQKATNNRLKRFENALINIPDNTKYTLKKLKEMNKIIGLISNADVSEMAGWSKSSIVPYFDKVIFSCDIGFVKPEKEIYEYAFKELNIKPEESVFIGDGGSNELYGAKQVGLSTIMITGIMKELWPDRIDSIKVNADYVIENINELVD